MADQCSGGSNVFTELQENSPHGTFVANLTVFGEPESGSLQLGLSGTDAGWFYLEGKTVRLSVSPGASLDREVGGAAAAGDSSSIAAPSRGNPQPPAGSSG